MQGGSHLPDWRSIDTVLLDMDGTLLDLGSDAHFWEELLPRRYAESRAISLDEARRQIDPIFEATKGTLDWYCIDYWTRALSVDILEMTRAVRHQIEWLPHARAFVESVRKTGRRTMLVTNAHPDVLAIKDAHLGIRRRFDAVYSSHELGEPKESATFWPRLAEREEFDPVRTLLADDNLAVLRAASAYGVRWLYSVRRPVRRWPLRPLHEFAGVESVHELAAGLAPAGRGVQVAAP